MIKYQGGLGDNLVIIVNENHSHLAACGAPRLASLAQTQSFFQSGVDIFM